MGSQVSDRFLARYQESNLESRVRLDLMLVPNHGLISGRKTNNDSLNQGLGHGSKVESRIRNGPILKLRLGSKLSLLLRVWAWNKVLS